MLPRTAAAIVPDPLTGCCRPTPLPETPKHRQIWLDLSWGHCAFHLVRTGFSLCPPRVSVSPVQFSSVAQSCPTLCDPMNCSTPGLPVHHQLPEFTQTHVHRISDAIQPSHPLSSLLLLPPIPPSIRVFSNESTLHMRGPKYWCFSLASFLPKKSQG